MMGTRHSNMAAGPTPWGSYAHVDQNSVHHRVQRRSNHTRYVAGVQALWDEIGSDMIQGDLSGVYQRQAELMAEIVAILNDSHNHEGTFLDASAVVLNVAVTDRQENGFHLDADFGMTRAVAVRQGPPTDPGATRRLRSHT